MEPEILYKYIPSYRINNYLIDKTIAFPKYDLLNDPFESSIESTQNYLKSFLKVPLFAQKPAIKYRTGIGFDFGVNPAYDNESNNLENETIYRINKQLNDKLYTLENYRKKTGIMSLTDNPLNSLMWAHYAENYKGICIGFDLSSIILNNKQKLCEFNNSKQFYFSIHKIKYNQDIPTYNNLSTEEYVLQAFTSKYIDWQYEREYRIFSPIHNGDIEIYSIDNNCIKEIYLGMRSSLDMNIIKEHLNSTKIYKVNPVINNYKLQFKEISI